MSNLANESPTPGFWINPESTLLREFQCSAVLRSFPIKESMFGKLIYNLLVHCLLQTGFA